jgi:hypothetical protein
MSKLLQEVLENGKAISPVLDAFTKNYLIDIDGTITEDVPNEDPERMMLVEPFPDALNTCNKWYNDGHIITFFTSRTENLRMITEDWLDKHGFLYHNVLMNKPRGGNYHWIDNHKVRATEFKGKFSEKFRKKRVSIELFEE